MTQKKDTVVRRRKNSLRLAGYDYSQAGYYFVTISTHHRESLFGEIQGRKMRLNEFGRLAHDTWNDLPNHNSNCHLDAFVIMPNHVHGIVIIGNRIDSAGTDSRPVGVGSEPTPTGSTNISEVIRGFKTFSARRINDARDTKGQPVWQRGFYDHIIRQEEDVENIRAYIQQNPERWERDRNNPSHSPKKHEA